MFLREARCVPSRRADYVDGLRCRYPGNIHSHQVRKLDWRARKASFKEKAPADIVQQVLDCVRALLED